MFLTFILAGFWLGLFCSTFCLADLLKGSDPPIIGWDVHTSPDLEIAIEFREEVLIHYVESVNGTHDPHLWRIDAQIPGQGGHGDRWRQGQEWGRGESMAPLHGDTGGRGEVCDPHPPHLAEQHHVLCSLQPNCHLVHHARRIHGSDDGLHSNSTGLSFCL